MKGLLLAGGYGTRLRPLTFTGNKHMIPIANQPMLFYGLRHIADAGIQDVGIVLGPLHEGISETVGDGSQFHLRVTYIHQGEPKGLAHAVRCARDFLGGEPFVMYLGDNLLQGGARPFVERYQQDPVDAIVGVTPVQHPSHYGIVELEGDRVVSIEEKPVNPRSDLALIGVYLFAPTIHPIIEQLRPSPRGELEITEAIWKLYQLGGRLKVQRVEGWWKDTGRPEDLLEANQKVLRSLEPAPFDVLGTIAPDATVTGLVRLGANSYVGSGVHIEGPVVIGSHTRIDSRAVIGPDTAIGSNCEIRGSTILRSIIMDSAEVEGALELTDSIVGRFARIRAGANRETRISCVLGDSTQLRI